MGWLLHTVKPRYSSPAFYMIPPIKQINFGLKKHFHSYLYIGNNENLSLKHSLGQSLEMPNSGVKLYFALSRCFVCNIRIKIFTACIGRKTLGFLLATSSATSFSGSQIRIQKDSFKLDWDCPGRANTFQQNAELIMFFHLYRFPWKRQQRGKNTERVPRGHVRAIHPSVWVFTNAR